MYETNYKIHPSRFLEPHHFFMGFVYDEALVLFKLLGKGNSIWMSGAQGSLGMHAIQGLDLQLGMNLDLAQIQESPQ